MSPAEHPSSPPDKLISDFQDDFQEKRIWRRLDILVMKTR